MDEGVGGVFFVEIESETVTHMAGFFQNLARLSTVRCIVRGRKKISARKTDLHQLVYLTFVLPSSHTLSISEFIHRLIKIS